MVEVLNKKGVHYRGNERTAQLCVHTSWRSLSNKTQFGTPFGLVTSDKETVKMYMKKGMKFSGSNYYFVRIMDKQGKCVIAFKPKKSFDSAEKQFGKFKK